MKLTRNLPQSHLNNMSQIRDGNRYFQNISVNRCSEVSADLQHGADENMKMEELEVSVRNIQPNVEHYYSSLQERGQTSPHHKKQKFELASKLGV